MPRLALVLLATLLSGCKADTRTMQKPMAEAPLRTGTWVCTELLNSIRAQNFVRARELISPLVKMSAAELAARVAEFPPLSRSTSQFIRDEGYLRTSGSLVRGRREVAFYCFHETSDYQTAEQSVLGLQVAGVPVFGMGWPPSPTVTAPSP